MSKAMVDMLGHQSALPGEMAPFEGAVRWLGNRLTEYGNPVDTGHWQSLKDVPQTKTIEARSVVLTYEIPATAAALQADVKPNQPWADAHFAERVGGEPLNPGETFKLWPWYRGNVETHKEQGQFSHTYMERYWPREAGGPNNSIVKTYGSMEGVRYRYGDLDDVVSLLAQEPYTRQAYLPVWFPEDTGAHHGERVPCSLGYHFMLRDGHLHCMYAIRSCDFLRHFRDDVYLTCRLVQWVIEQLAKRAEPNEEAFASPEEELWNSVEPGHLTMIMHSLHVFEGDMPKMKKEYGNR